MVKERRKINPNRSEGLDGDDLESFLADLRGMLWQHSGKEGDFAEFAAKANLHPTTVSKLAYGETMRPHAFTVFKIMRALGLWNKLRALVNTGESITREDAKSRKK